MAVQLTGLGGIFTRWGLLLNAVNDTNTWRSTTLETTVDDILGQYLSNEQLVISGLPSDSVSYAASASQWVNTLSTDAQNTIIAQAERDTPLPALTLSYALQLLISQMTSSGNSCAAPTITVTPTNGSSNYGDAKLGATAVDTDGKTCNFVFAETINGVVTNSAGLGATAYQEPVNFTGEASVQPLDPFWPAGSGTNISLSINNAAVNGIITNGNWLNWTTNVPDNWSVGVGTPGTTLVRGVVPLRGTYNLEFVGNGSQLTSIYQNITSGLIPNTIYALSFWAKRSVGAAAGVLRVRLADGSNTTITDDNGGSCSTSITVSSGLTTSYQNFLVFWVTPKIIPSTTNIWVELTTALTNTETVDISLLGITPATRLYPSGISASLWSGGTQAAIGDSFSIAVTNSHGTTNFIPALNRFLQLTQLNLKLPTSLSAYTIPDSLI